MMRKMIMATVCAMLGAVAFGEDNFKTLGAMIDVSRGRVYTVDYLKTRFDQMSKMGYNMVMLYTEDVFKLEGEPKWGYMRGGYSVEDIKNLKAHAEKLGIRMIPCIETLGHLEQPLRWSEYAGIRNTRSTLLVGEPGAYKLLDKVIGFWKQAIGGNTIHLGMDEAFGFAGGKYKMRDGEKNALDVFLNHLKKVNEICAKHGFTDLIIWSDMLYRLASPKHDYYDPTAKADPSLVARIPKNVRLCYWDYYHGEQSYYEGMIDGHRTLGSEPILAGGIQLWQHFLNDREKSIATAKAFINAAKVKKCKEFFFTIWGDDGGYAIPDVMLEGLFAGAEMAAGRTPEPTPENCKRFKEITGLDYASLAKLGDVNRHYADEWPDMIQEASILYDDPLYCGNYRNYLVRKPSETKDRRFYCAVYKDAAWRDDGVKVLAEHRKVLEECKKLKGIPRVAKKLVETLSAKFNYEADILAAWRNKDKAAIAFIATNDLPKTIRLMKSFTREYRNDWHATSQPFGFERMQKRNASQIARLEEAQLRLKEYVEGKVETIPEFDEAMKPFGKYNAGGVISW